MEETKLALRKPIPSDEMSFIDAVEATVSYGEDETEWTFAFDFLRDETFPAYLDRMENWEQGINLPENFVSNSFLVGVVNNKIVGRLSIRHELTEFLENIGGHIGYGVVPDERRKGYATAMLEQSLPYCQKLGLPKVLITCDEDNLASVKIIENCGGEFENQFMNDELRVPKNRYWIYL